MAARKRSSVVTSPDEGTVTTPPEGEVTKPAEGEATTPAEDEQPGDAEQRELGDGEPSQSEDSGAESGDHDTDRADGAGNGSPDAYDPATHIAQLLAEQASEVDVTPTTVIMQIAISGTRDGEPWPRPGQELELPADEAERMVRLGYARPAD